MKKTIKQHHIEYLEKYNDGTSYWKYNKIWDGTMTDEQIHRRICLNKFGKENMLDILKEEAKKELIEDLLMVTEEGFDWEDLEYIKQNQYVH